MLLLQSSTTTEGFDFLGGSGSGSDSDSGGEDEFTVWPEIRRTISHSDGIMPVSFTCDSLGGCSCWLSPSSSLTLTSLGLLPSDGKFSGFAASMGDADDSFSAAVASLPWLLRAEEEAGNGDGGDDAAAAE